MTSSRSCTSARTASRSTSSNWRRRSPPTGGTLDAVAAALPETLLDAVLLRTDALSSSARSALERAAVVGQRCDAEQVSDGASGDAVAEALAAGFLVAAGPGHLEFRHALVRDAIYEAIPWTRRRSLHGSVARALAEAGAPASERAAHWLGAGETARARAALTEAAETSASVYAYRDAATLYERALELGGTAEPVRFDLLERLATCAELAGDLAGSARAWREAIDGRASRGEVENVAEAQHAIGRVLALRGSPERALAAWIGRRRLRSRRAGDPRTLPAPGSRPLRSCTSAGACAPPSRPSRRPSPSSRRARHPTSARARARSRAWCWASSGETPKALASPCTRRSPEALSAGQPATAATAYQALASVHENAGEHGKASEAFEVAIDYCASTGIERDARRLLGLPLRTSSASAANGGAAWSSAGR